MAHCRPSVITSIDIPNFAEIGKTFCGRMDVRTYLLMDISDPFYVIRSTRRSRPHNALNSKLIKVTLRQRICYFWQTTVYKECGFWRLFVERFALCYLSVVCLSVTLGPLVANGWMDQEETWHGGRPRRRRHRVTWGPISPPKRGDSSPHFSAHVLWPDGWMDQDAIWYGGRPQPRPHCVRWDPAPPKGAQPPIFLACVYCGQTVAWIKMPLGMKIGVGPGNIVLDGDPTPPEMGHSPPNFRLMSVVAKRLV